MNRAPDYPLWSVKKIRALQEQLLSWYQSHQRTLPWRSKPTPYRVWIAEIMLQQTRVRTVLPFYDRFLKRFPDIHALAAAAEQDVMEMWAGLGYYRRARNLHEAARRIAAEWGGIFPNTLAEIMRLPGVGRYTAGAIHSIAFNQPQPVVDGNVVRVISRLHGLPDAPDSFFWQQAESLLARENPAEFNQAIMELGALVCIPRNPLCAACPLRSLCRSGRERRVVRARRSASRAQELVDMILLLIECGGKILLARQSEGEFIPGAWGLPVSVLRKNGVPARQAGRMVRGILGTALPLQSFPPIRHSITYRNIRAHIYRAVVPPPPPVVTRTTLSWHPRSGMERMLTSSIFHKALAAAASRALLSDSGT
jgi:A/G-specific adenine glycosylase